MRDEPFDLIIVGAGVAGLALARAFVTGPAAGLRLAIVEPKREPLGHRSLAYVAWKPRPTDDLARRVFQRIVVAGREGVVDTKLEAARYVALDGGRYAHATRELLLAHPDVTWLRAEALAASDESTSVRLLTSAGPLRARWVMDSRPALLARPRALPRHDVLHQSFLGWEVETEVDAFDPDAATLLDFRDLPQEDAARFSYVLPFGRRHALFELVTLGARCEPERLEALVASRARGPYRVVRREGGASLLTTAPFPRWLAPRRAAIGIAGGLLKPSTGYAFASLLDDADAMAASLARTGLPYARLGRRWPWSFFDGVFLHLAADAPAVLDGAITALFRSGGERALRFLDERASVRDVLEIGRVLPFGPFAGAFAGWTSVRLGLAPRRVRLSPEHVP